MAEIPVERLCEVIDILLEPVAPDAGSTLIVDKEASWAVPKDQAYDVYSQPSELTIGMASDSWSQLEAIAEDQGPAVGHGFVWLAGVLLAVGDGMSG